MAYYESVFIARPDITNVQVEAISDSFKAIVAEYGGSATKDEYWGLRSLAYRIKKNRKGHYVMLNLDAPADAISELERNMRLNEDVIRFMTIKVDSLNEEPSIMMRNKTARDEKNRRDGFVEEQYADDKVVKPTQKDQGEGQ
ncbi:MAG: 30S ribosomal protein S6 [Pseudomonadota bacterium]|nr:30S ribosomal protein S6 [Pseudomonadota bacterium]